MTPFPAAAWCWGVAACVVEAERTPAGCAVTLCGLQRREVTALLSEPRPRAATRAWPTAPLPAEHLADRVRAFRVHAMHWARARCTRAAETIATAEAPEQLIDFVVAHLDLPLDERQRILQRPGLDDRLDAATRAISGVLQHFGAIPNAADPECSEHGALAHGACLRCGCFVCETCLGPKPEERRCRACRRIAHPPPAPPSAVAQALVRPPAGITWGFAFVVAWLIAARRSIAIAGLVGALGLAVFLAATALVPRRAEPLRRRTALRAAALYGLLAAEFAVRVFLVH